MVAASSYLVAKLKFHCEGCLIFALDVLYGEQKVKSAYNRCCNQEAIHEVVLFHMMYLKRIAALPKTSVSHNETETMVYMLYL